MKKRILLSCIIFLFVGCSSSDIYNISRAAVSKNPTNAFKYLASAKTVHYAANPKSLEKDLNYIDKNFQKIILTFAKAISGEWGKENIELPQKEKYVKYLQNYKSRALIDFDKGLVQVETLDEKETLKSLQNAIVTTLLLPNDPRAADLFNAKSVKLGSTPYLLGEVKDDQKKNIRYSWRANRYAKLLIQKSLMKKTITKNRKKVKVTYVNIPMVKDHATIRVTKFKPFVKSYAKKYDLSENLVYAIIKTESNFNQFAVSHAGAFGLMQIVPTSAGKDAYLYVKKKKWIPSKSYLFNAKNNIELGSAYLKILNKKYLTGIYNPISKEYCVISAYNTGSGNVLKTFSKNRTTARNLINKKTPAQVYTTLREKLPYVETRRYLKKVIDYKKKFVAL